MRHLTPLLIASLALLLAVGGCFDSAPAGLSATIDTPASPASGDVAVGFSVSDPDKAPADVTLEYALDGVTFVPATVSGTTTGLASDGTPHAISWDSLADLGATAATGVVLKLTPEAGGKHGAAATSAPFAVDNLVASAGGNAPPTVVIVDPKGASHAGGLIPGETFYGHLLVSLTIADAEGDPASFAVEYSTDGGSTYAAATAADDAPTSGLAAPAGGASHSFLWDSIADLGAVDVEVQLRVTPSDGKPGRPVRSGFLLVHNEALDTPRGPMLQLVGKSSITLKWRTRQRTTTLVDYGTTADLGKTHYVRKCVTDHLVTLTGLAPDTYYHYAVSGSGGAVAASKFRTTPPPGSAFSFVAFGDSGVGGLLLDVQKKLAGYMVDLDPDLLIHTGDVVYPNGEDKHYEERFFLPYVKLLARAGTYATLGNHDVKTDDGAPYLKIFELPENNPAKTERYYSFDYGDVHFVCLDTTHKDKMGPGTPQYDWLVADLAKADRKFIVVFWHHPMYSSGRHGSQAWVKSAWEDVLETYGVDLVLVGHDHIYERTLPMKGVTHVLTGGGGAPVYPVKKGNPFTDFVKADWNFVHVGVTGSSLKVTAYDLLGKAIDTHTITK